MSALNVKCLREIIRYLKDVVEIYVSVVSKKVTMTTSNQIIADLAVGPF